MDKCFNCKFYETSEYELPCGICKRNYREGSEEYRRFIDLFNPRICDDEMEEDDVVNHPSHYCQGSIECIDAMESAFGLNNVMIYCHINAFKYLWRTIDKNGIEDIKKAAWYLNKMIELHARKEGGF